MDSEDAVAGEDPTPLIDAVACTDRKFTEIEALLAAGADVHERAPDGSTVLHALSASDGDESGFDADTAALQCLLQRLLGDGADLEAVTEWGWTPLTSAVVACDKALTQALLAAGANPNVRFSQRTYPAFARGWTLAHFCVVQTSGADLLRLLMRGGADLRRLNEEGQSVLGLCEETLQSPAHDMDEEFLNNVRECESLLRGI